MLKDRRWDLVGGRRPVKSCLRTCVLLWLLPVCPLHHLVCLHGSPSLQRSIHVEIGKLRRLKANGLLPYSGKEKAGTEGQSVAPLHSRASLVNHRGPALGFGVGDRDGANVLDH